MTTRVAVDARQVYRANRRGIGKSLRLLLGHLAAARPRWEFRLLHQADSPDEPFPDRPPNLVPRKIDIPGDRFGLWEQVRLPLAAWRAGADVLYCPANTGPRWPLRPTVLTVYDLIPLELDPTNPANAVWGKSVARAARAARRVHTASDHTARQLTAILGIPPRKIEMIPIAADPRFAPVSDPAEISAVRARYNVPPDRPFVLGFGAADPRKNTRRVLEAWSRLPPGLRDHFFLLLVGIQDGAMPTFRQLAAELLPPGGWHLHGFADESDLPTLLSASDVLCYPSLAEGFGLPVLEAFGCGTAVLTSDTTSLPEVTGDAALLVNPTDTTAITRGLEELLTDGRQRAQLAARGLARATHFAWPAVAEDMADLFRRVARM
jgi:glycosyltransferase involved in cell wall biosynthesis